MQGRMLEAKANECILSDIHSDLFLGLCEYAIHKDYASSVPGADSNEDKGEESDSDSSDSGSSAENESGRQQDVDMNDGEESDTDSSETDSSEEDEEMKLDRESKPDLEGIHRTRFEDPWIDARKKCIICSAVDIRWGFEDRHTEACAVWKIPQYVAMQQFRAFYLALDDASPSKAARKTFGVLHSIQTTYELAAASLIYHAKLCVLAQRYLVKPLRELCLGNLHHLLDSLELENSGAYAVLDLLSHVCSDPDVEGVPKLQELVLLYVTSRIQDINRYERFRLMVNENKDVACALLPKLALTRESS